MSPDRKRALRDELLRILEEDLRAAHAAHRATTEGATHAEAKPENDKDTRALEQTYLARGQAMRVEELTTGVAEVQGMPVRAITADGPVSLGALVHVCEGDDRRLYFIAPHGGGAKLEGGAVHVVTPKSPLGRGLIGKRTGEMCEVVVAGKRRELEIEAIE
jgi:transcription elongation GreA/GreB family factor